MRGDDEDYTMSTKGRLVDRMRVILAGRAAEEVGSSPFLPVVSSLTNLFEVTLALGQGRRLPKKGETHNPVTMPNVFT